MFGLAAAFIAAASPFAADAQTRTISNVASAAWDAGGRRSSKPSNRVDLPVEAAPPTTLTTLHREPGGAVSAPIAATRCGGSASATSIAWGPAFAGVSLDSGWSPSRKLRAGEAMAFALSSPAANRDPASIDPLTVELRTGNGDREALTLTETGPNSGLFAGGVPTIAGDTPVVGDCRITISAGMGIAVAIHAIGGAQPMAQTLVDFLIDPFGIVFDSTSGAPVAGVRVTLLDADTGRLARVYGEDGVSAYPPSVITGESVVDAGGTRYEFPPGDYRFPLAPPGRYRLKVEPPAPYVAPSAIPAAQLTRFIRPDGLAYTISGASYGDVFTLADPAPLRVDIPIDGPPSSLFLTKAANVATAEPGDVVQYRIIVRNGDAARASGAITVTDSFPAGFRYRAGSARYNGAKLADVTSDGRGFVVALPALAPSASGELRYLLEVLGTARAGDAVNRALAISAGGIRSPFADAVVRVSRETISARLTVTGRVTDGGCLVDPRQARGIGGVRVMLEDGSYAVTDGDGRYHFEGVVPGIHVVQLDASTLPADRVAVDCARDTRSAGRAFSRFVEGGGGAHKRVDFRAAAAPARAVGLAVAQPRPVVRSDAAAAGAEIDLFGDGEPGAGFLFPATDYNPRARVTRVAIRHAPAQTVALRINGRPADALTFEGMTKSADGRIATSRWRGVPLETDSTRLDATVTNADGTTASTLSRTVHFADSAMRAEIVGRHSLLVADGVTRPVIAVRMLTRDGRPVHHGSVGAFTLPASYRAAVEVDAQQARQLSGLERAQPLWRVDGDDGLALIALEPTTASGTVAIDFPFRDGEARRDARVEAWLDAGDRPWTVVGFAAGTVGFNTLKGGMETLGHSEKSGRGEKIGTDGRIALYAKGRVRGRWLLTVAYDSDKKARDARFAGTIDPQAYYTIYADRSERRYDASSLRKLYLKLERPQFYALFGDYDTGLSETVLTRYARAFNGFKAEHRGRRFAATAFAADTAFTHRREEIQGNGLSGPYGLRARDILANSEHVAIETRDRFRSNLVIERRELTRHIDYDIDYFAGTIRFREPILSRASGLNPQFIVADYEVDGVAGRAINAGGRASYENGGGSLRIGATAVRDADEDGATALGGVDVRFRPNASTEVRAEVAASDASDRASTGSKTGSSAPATAWLVEAEHHGRRADFLAYAREQESGFGVGQTNASEDRSRKIGAEGRLRITDALSVSVSGWREDYTDRDARRTAGRALIEYRGAGADLRAGLVFADDRLANGEAARSTLVQLGASKRLFANRLEIDGNTEFALGGRDDSVDFPARHRIGARFAVTPEVNLIAGYEVANGKAVDARTLRVGFDLKPWAGARFAVTGNRQQIAEYGPRSFAAYGLSQSLALGKRWTVDATLDGNRTLGGIDPSRVLNPPHPVASGGFVGDGSRITEDFTAVTAGATYRAARWSGTARAEYRAGTAGDRYGVTAAALRQVGEGSALGGAFHYTVAEVDGGAHTRASGLALSWAHRPADSRLSWLQKLELRSDSVSDAVLGAASPIGGATLLVDGDARSRRIVSSLSVNWSPVRGGSETWRDAAEVSVFWGARYASERFGADDVRGLSNVVGADVRFNLLDKLDVGVSGTVRHGLGARAISYAVGPSVGGTPFTNGWLSVGYNFTGFRDRDFEDARYLRSGAYATLRVKFDQMSVAELMRGAR